MPNKTEVLPLPERPIRFGILDCVAAIVLFGLHLGLLKALLIKELGHRVELEPHRMAAAAVLCAAFAFGAAYLAFRYATSKHIPDFRGRLMALLFIDLALLAIPLMFYVGDILPALSMIAAILTWALGRRTPAQE